MSQRAFVKGWQLKSSAEFKRIELDTLLRVLEPSTRLIEGPGPDGGGASSCHFAERKCEKTSDNSKNYAKCFSANATTHHLLPSGNGHSDRKFC